MKPKFAPLFPIILLLGTVTAEGRTIVSLDEDWTFFAGDATGAEFPV